MKKEFEEWKKFCPDMNKDLQAAFLTAFGSLPRPTAIEVLKRGIDNKVSMELMVEGLASLKVDVSLLKTLLTEPGPIPVVLKPASAVPMISPRLKSAAPKTFIKRPMPQGDGSLFSSPDGAEGDGAEDAPQVGIDRPKLNLLKNDGQPRLALKEEKKGLGKWFDAAKSKLPGGKKDDAPLLRPGGLRRPMSGGSSGFGGGNSVTDFLSKRWQTIAIGLLAMVFMFGVVYLGPISGSNGDGQVHSSGSPISTLPLVVVFALLIAIPMFLESIQRGDSFDAVVVFLCLVMSSVASMYEQQISSFKIEGGRPIGTYLVGFLFLAPYLTMWLAASTNRTRNPFSGKIFSKFDFSPVFNSLLFFWAMAQAREYWTWLPNPCFFPVNFYLFAGLIFLLVEISGNYINLLIALAVGVSSGFLIFDSDRFWWSFVLFLLLVLYSSTDYATKEMTMNVDDSSAGGGTSFGRGVKTKRFVPYDLLVGTLWITLISAVIWNGNPAFQLNLPF